MAAEAITNCAAGALATYLDEMFAARWSEPGTMLALAENPLNDQTNVRLVALDGHPATSLGPGPPGPVNAVGISSFGSAVRLDLASKQRVLVRVTVAIACCSTVAILRHQDGQVNRSARAGGSVVELLRAWANLSSCPSCSIDTSW